MAGTSYQSYMDFFMQDTGFKYLYSKKVKNNVRQPRPVRVEIAASPHSIVIRTEDSTVTF